MADISKIKTLDGTTYDLKDATARENLSNAILRGTVQAVTENGTSASITLTGLTENHVVGNWGMFSDANCTIPIPENAPTCNLTITTATNGWTYTVANFTATFYLRPTFVLYQN